MRRLRTNPLLGDSVFALVLAAAGEAEVWTTGGSSAALRAAVAAAMTLPLVARRSFPLLTVLAVMGAALAQSLIDAHADFAGVLVIAIIVAAYSVAAHETRAIGAVGGGAGLASLLISAHREGGGVGNYVFASAIFIGAWLAGFTVRERRLRAEALEERTVELEQDQEARARAAVAEERERIARDLHDVVAHSMSVIVVQAGAERLALPEELASTREVLASIEQTGRQGLVEMRRLVEMLRQDDEELALAPQPSVAYLDLLVQQVREAGLPVELLIEGEPAQLPPGIDLSAYRIVQEALTNALKHAGPARALVTVRYRPSHLELEVADDGSGTGEGGGGRQGLVGMRERVAVFGGVLAAGRRAEGGYLLRATLPLGSGAP